MSPGNAWLSLKYSRPETDRGARIFHISVPKKTVRLATRRNRVKRLLREALRAVPRFEEAGVYVLRVERLPEKLGLAGAVEALRALPPAKPKGKGRA